MKFSNVAMVRTAPSTLLTLCLYVLVSKASRTLSQPTSQGRILLSPWLPPDPHASISVYVGALRVINANTYRPQAGNISGPRGLGGRH